MKRRLKGIAVTSTKEHTVRVRVARSCQHPKYKKRYISYTDFLVHDSAGITKENDAVLIEETRPISKRKRFVVVYQKVNSTK